MTAICRNCEYWTLYNIHDEPFPDGWGRCVVAETQLGNPLSPHSMAVALDSEEYNASLLTNPDFGCNQFQEGQK